MKVALTTAAGRALGEYELPAGAVLHDLKVAVHAAHPRLHADRQRMYHAQPAVATTARPGARPQALRDEAELFDGDVLLFKDLGPQVSWKVVFIVEYLGPLLVYPLFFLKPRWIYGDAVDIAQTQWAKEVQLSALIAWSIHYAKRELETLFVHRFSHATMPAANLFKNSIYYWGFAAFVSFFVNHPLYTPPPDDLVYGGMCLFYFMEVGNFSCHWTLRMLRPPGTKVRRIPVGGLFDYVTCPNYTYEILAWFGFNLMTRTLAGVLFMLAGAFQMFVWAKGKHINYRKEFDGKDGRELYPRGRKIIVPFIY
jgi:very-long-chain enoyl-CoA reductase